MNQSGSQQIEQVAGGNNWFMQQNWQQQQQQIFTPEQSHQQKNFFDNIPIATQTHPASIPQPPRNNLESNKIDGWGEWEDWSQTETKPSHNLLVNHPISEHFVQSQSKPILTSNEVNSAPGDNNWCNQNHQPTSHILNEPVVTLASTFCSTIAAPPPQFQSSAISPISTQSTIPLLPKANASTVSSVGTMFQHNVFSTFAAESTRNSADILNANQNQECNVPENVDVFVKAEQPQITPSNMHVNDKSYVTPVQQNFHNYPETEEVLSSKNQTNKLSNQIDDNSLISQELKFYSPNSHHPLTINVLGERTNQFPTNVPVPSHKVHHSVLSTIPTPPLTNSVTAQSTSYVSDTLEDRNLFLNQEDRPNERDRFLNQPGRQENLLPPPIAYQQTPTANDDRNQYLQTSHLSEDDFVVLNNPSNDDDINLPPPGLSRFVLGEPEHTAHSERHADGEDGNALHPTPTSISSETNRNVYSFPTSPIDLQVQRVVTGVESMSVSQPNIAISQQVESREIDLDGENIEDQQQVVKALREKPTIGGDPSSNEPETHNQTVSNVLEVKHLSNSSTGNESDHKNESKKYSSKPGKARNRFESDDSEGSSERDRLRRKEKDKKRNPLRGSDDGEYYRQKNYKKREEKSGHNR